MTEGEFFLALAKLAEKYRDGSSVHYVLISKHANEHGLDIDEDASYDEQAEILRPLQEFLKSVVNKADMLWLCAHAHLSWEAYQKYLDHRQTRIRGHALSEQSRLRHAH